MSVCLTICLFVCIWLTDTHISLSREHLTAELLATFLKLTKFLVTSQNNNSDLLLKQLLGNSSITSTGKYSKDFHLFIHFSRRQLSQSRVSSPWYPRVAKNQPKSCETHIKVDKNHQYHIFENRNSTYVKKRT